MNNSDLLNSEKLDESVSNLINESLLDGLTENTSLLNASGEEFYYATAKKDLQKLSGCKKPAAPVLGLLTSGISNINYKKRKKAYEDCMKNYKASLEAQKKEVAASTQRKEEVEAELNRVKSELENSSAERTGGRVVTDTFLGMPKAVGITVAIVGGLALLVGGVVLVKKLRAN
jgi:hypothetical protein